MTTPSISKIAPGLYLGDYGSSCNILTLASNEVTAMVSLMDGSSAHWDSPPNREKVPQDRHKFIPARDDWTQDLLAVMTEACDFIDEKMTEGNVLVHCAMGISRSATIVVAYLMRKNRQPLDVTLKFVRESRRVKPNPNFMRQLTVWGETEYELWEDVAKAIPKPPYAAYLEARAKRLEELGLTEDEPTESTLVPPSDSALAQP